MKMLRVMRPSLVAVSIYVVGMGAAQAFPTDPTAAPALARTLVGQREDQREINEKAYQSGRDYLREVHKGRWVVIVDGLVMASFAKLDEALVAADERNPDADHRFIFRPGVDDGDEDFVQSPWSNDNPSWFQLGRRFQKAFPTTRSWDTWYRDGKSVAAPGGRARVSLSVPGSSADPITSNAFPVASALFEQDITVSGQVAEHLGLARFSVPGTAWIDWTERLACRKVLCRMRLEELDIDTTLVAFVFPKETVAALQLTPRPEEFIEIWSGSRGEGEGAPEASSIAEDGAPGLIRGQIPPAEDPADDPAEDRDRTIAWGPARDGLQAGVRLPGGDAFRVGDQVELEFLVRNVGDGVIRLESSDWREEDEITLQTLAGERVGVDQIWYSGMPRMGRYELRPAEQVMLRSGAFGIRPQDKVHSEHPVVYDAHIGPGTYTMSFRLRFPDIDREDAPRSDDFRGILNTGAVNFSVSRAADDA